MVCDSSSSRMLEYVNCFAADSWRAWVLDERRCFWTASQLPAPSQSPISNLHSLTPARNDSRPASRRSPKSPLTRRRR